jgi:hypothetical protein
MLDKASQYESGNPEMWKELGLTYHMQGKESEAYAAFERYRSLAPNAADLPDIEKIMDALKEYK